MRCVGYCTQRAVEASHLWLAVVIFATMPFTATPMQRAATALFGVHLELPGPVWALVGLVPTFVAVVLLYYLFFGMQRVRPLRVALSTLTWTRYFRRRYHDPETELKQLR